MEQMERTASATSFVDAFIASYRRLVAMFDTGHRPVSTWTDDVAFSDELERELIRRELHAH